MPKLHPFPGVRVIPSGYRRWLVVRTTVVMDIGEVYAPTITQAEALAKDGRLSNVKTADRHSTCIGFPHPDDTEWKEQDSEDTSLRDADRANDTGRWKFDANGFPIATPDEA